MCAYGFVPPTSVSVEIPAFSDGRSNPLSSADVVFVEETYGVPMTCKVDNGPRNAFASN